MKNSIVMDGITINPGDPVLVYGDNGEWIERYFIKDLGDSVEERYICSIFDNDLTHGASWDTIRPIKINIEAEDFIEKMKEEFRCGGVAGKFRDTLIYYVISQTAKYLLSKQQYDGDGDKIVPKYECNKLIEICEKESPNV